MIWYLHSMAFVSKLWGWREVIDCWQSQVPSLELEKYEMNISIVQLLLINFSHSFSAPINCQRAFITEMKMLLKRKSFSKLVSNTEKLRIQTSFLSAQILEHGISILRPFSFDIKFSNKHNFIAFVFFYIQSFLMCAKVVFLGFSLSASFIIFLLFVLFRINFSGSLLWKKFQCSFHVVS